MCAHAHMFFVLQLLVTMESFDSVHVGLRGAWWVGIFVGL